MALAQIMVFSEDPELDFQDLLTRAFDEIQRESAPRPTLSLIKGGK